MKSRILKLLVIGLALLFSSQAYAGMGAKKDTDLGSQSSQSSSSTGQSSSFQNSPTDRDLGNMNKSDIDSSQSKKDQSDTSSQSEDY